MLGVRASGCITQPPLAQGRQRRVWRLADQDTPWELWQRWLTVRTPCSGYLPLLRVSLDTACEFSHELDGDFQTRVVRSSRDVFNLRCVLLIYGFFPCWWLSFSFCVLHASGAATSRSGLSSSSLALVVKIFPCSRSNALTCSRTASGNSSASLAIVRVGYLLYVVYPHALHKVQWAMISMPFPLHHGQCFMVLSSFVSWSLWTMRSASQFYPRYSCDSGKHLQKIFYSPCWDDALTLPLHCDHFLQETDRVESWLPRTSKRISC